MEDLKYLHDVIENRHQYARKWKKERGTPVLGCFNDYVPEEIIYAAGILPVRIIGSREHQNITDSHISQDKWCRYCCNCLADGLKGRYDYLDGITTTICCSHLQQSFDSWQRHLRPSFQYCLEMPFYAQGNFAPACYKSALDIFIGSLEEWGGVTITEEGLRRANETYNKNRQLIRQIFELRKAHPPQITGGQAMEIVMSSMLMDKEEHNCLLERILNRSNVLPEKDSEGPRLMIVGAESDDRETVELIESMGAYVVTDVHSMGTRYFWNDVMVDGDPVFAIAERYLSKIPFPQTDFPEDLLAAYSLQFAKEYHVRGAIVFLNTHCDPFQWEVPVLKRYLSEIDSPVMALELDPVRASSQTKVRIEAFIEMLQGLIS